MTAEQPTYREASDTMGTVRIPETAYWGAQTQRAIENSAISGAPMPGAMIEALALIKKHCARVNMEMGRLDPDIASAIIQVAREVAAGRFQDQFPVDVFQTGSGTSTHMNMNEVLAARANELLTGHRADKRPIHPNDHVNMGQSSNDVMPTALHVAAARGLREKLLPALERLEAALAEKAVAFSDISKIGRTHLQDAVPMRLGDEFSAFSRQMALGMERIRSAEGRLQELALGGTAVGNGINTVKGFAERVIEGLSRETGLPFYKARNHFEAQSARDAAVELSGQLRTVAVSLMKIANDIRVLGSGPRCGIGEIRLPELQPGSSIMPGKVNPVIPEIVIQAAAQVLGNDAAVAIGGQWGQFQLNAMVPLICRNLLGSIDLLSGAAADLANRCVADLEADPERCAAAVEKSLALVTALVPRLGYDRAAAIAKAAYASGKTIRQVIADTAEISLADFDRLVAGSP